jgi:L-amino acid N-acyltransferase YncA
MPGSLRLTTFKDVDLADPFFDSLKAQYAEFSEWFAKKSKTAEPVYVVDDDTSGALRGFVYLKREDGAIDDVTPPLPAASRLKVGTLKVVAKGTKLGERIIKRIFDRATDEGVTEIYVTVFDTHQKLIDLFKRYGFEQKGVKETPNGTELVLVRSLTSLTGDIIKDYPYVHMKGRNIYLLAIRPQWHTDLFADSILKTEDPEIVKDASHSNTIHKVYVAGLSLTRMKRGDIVVMYRTTDIPGRAKYRSVGTSICVVEEAKSRKAFPHAKAFVDYAEPHSVFSSEDLELQYNNANRLYVVRMTYNIALRRRITRQRLMEIVGISEQPRWDLRPLTRKQFDRILDLGKVNETLIVD